MTDSNVGAEARQAPSQARKRDLALVSRSTYMKEKGLQYLFFACAFLAVVTVALIFAFTMMQAAPVFTDIGASQLLQPHLGPTEGRYGILSLLAGSWPRHRGRPRPRRSAGRRHGR